jgi:hypothetical protein
MAIVKASYTRAIGAAKAAIRYIGNRPGKDGAKTQRSLFNADGKMERSEAYQMVDQAQKGSYFFRLVISPDPNREDTGKDLSMREVTEKTMASLEKRFNTPLQWVAVIHADHAPHRHVHAIAILPERLNVRDFQLLREAATEAALEQRHALDVVREQKERSREVERQW